VVCLFLKHLKKGQPAGLHAGAIQPGAKHKQAQNLRRNKISFWSLPHSTLSAELHRSRQASATSLQTIVQSLFGDQRWASLLFATLDVKQPLDKLG
jgi:hypothetical protein